MQRVVIDTNIYIDWLNEGRYEDIIFQREAVKHLSADVLMELLAGGFFSRGRRVILGINLPFSQDNRNVIPTPFIYLKDGGGGCRDHQPHRADAELTPEKTHEENLHSPCP